MARRVFFSFHYEHVWRANQIRNIHNVIGCSAAGFRDGSLWEEAKENGDAVVKRLIDEGLKNTSVTVVCVTLGTINRRYINYEIDKSLERGNGLVAVQIHDLKDRYGGTSQPGTIPPKIAANGFKAYKYSNQERLATWIEEAGQLAGR